MKLADFDFDLPQELIAQAPTDVRDQSNLILPFDNNKIVKFGQIIDYLNPGDLMVFNDSKVINAKLTLNKNGKKINVNLNKPTNENVWRGFARPSKKLVTGDEFLFDKHKLVISNKLDFGEIEITFILHEIDIFSFLEIYGEVPLPAYIKRDKANKEDVTRYQNVYSSVKGSVAAPTAGLHFTKELLEKIQNKKVEIQFVTLHVGAGTFLPVKVDNIQEHKMHTEYCQITDDVADAINRAKISGRRIISVGTTVTRVLESFAENDKLASGIKETNIFITPGYQFQIVDSLITNFHLPKSTLFMLVCAFAGIEKMKSLYEYAISKKMRFFSYGDAMMLERSS